MRNPADGSSRLASCSAGKNVDENRVSGEAADVEHSASMDPKRTDAVIRRRIPSAIQVADDVQSRQKVLANAPMRCRSLPATTALPLGSRASARK